MKHRLLTYLCLLPIILLGLSLLLWLRSYIPGDFYCRSHDGRLLLCCISGPYTTFFEPGNGSRDIGSVLREFAGSRDNALNCRYLGFQLIVSGRYITPTYTILAIPFPAIIILLAPLSLWSYHIYRQRRQRLLPGHCLTCGYDLRASTDTCPECGSPIPPTTTPLPR